MTEQIRFGILGCGRIVERGLLPGLAESPAARLCAIASQRLGVAEEWAGQHGADSAYDSYDELLADPQVQAVYVPCRGDEHHRWVIAAAQGRKACAVREAAGDDRPRSGRNGGGMPGRGRATAGGVHVAASSPGSPRETTRGRGD